MKRLLFIILFSCIGANLFAQQKDAVTIIADRSSALIDSTMSGLNVRANIFNAELNKVNALNPLDTLSLVPDTIKRNIGAIKDFLSYLDLYRSLSEKTLESIKDSVEHIRPLIPKMKRETYLKEFIDAYTLDHKAFEKFTLALTDLYSKVLDALTFLKESGMTGRYKQLTSKEEYEKYKSDSEKYKKILAGIQKNAEKVKSAGEKSQRATTEASIAMQKAYGDVRK